MSSKFTVRRNRCVSRSEAIEGKIFAALSKRSQVCWFLVSEGPTASTDPVVPVKWNQKEGEGDKKDQPDHFQEEDSHPAL